MSTSLKDLAYTYIRGRLIDGHIGPGTRLSSRALAREIGVSFIPVREAITQLSAEGLVEHEPGVGTFATRVTLDDLRELYELREALEVHSVGAAADRVTGEDLVMIKAWNEKMRTIAERRAQAVEAGVASAAGTPSTGNATHPASTRGAAPSSATQSEDPNGDVKAWNECDLEFHSAILRAAGNKRVVRAVKDLRVLTQVFRSQRVLRPVVDLWSALQHHDGLIDCLARHDAASARSMMAMHIRFGCKNALEVYAGQRPAP